MNAGCPPKEKILDVVNGIPDAAVGNHLRACAACRELQSSLAAAGEALTGFAPKPDGRCLTEGDLVDYLHSRNVALESHLASCSKCQDELVALSESLDSYESGAFPAALGARIKEIAPRKSGSSPTLRSVRKPTGKHTAVRRPKPFPVLPWAIAAAAVALFALVFMTMGNREPQKAPTTPIVKQEPRVPEVERPKDLPKPEPKPDPKPAPEPEKQPEEVVKPGPKPEPPKPEPEKTPDPIVKPTPEPEKRPEPPTKAEDRAIATALTAVRGAAQVGDRPLGVMELSKEDLIVTGRLQMAAFDVGTEYSVCMREDSAVRLEKRETGAVRITIEKGEAYFRVAPRAHPYVVATAHADVEVRGTAFSVVAESKRAVVAVSEGLVHFRNAKGGVDVKAGGTYSADATSKPRALSALDLKAAFAWTRRPDLAGDALPSPWMEHYATTKKMPGVAVSGPYSEWEVDSGRLAREVAAKLECGLFLGHAHRDKKDRKLWINIDRGTEGIVATDGTVGLAQATERAKKYYDEYLVHIREAAGVGAKQPANFILTLRDHSETVGGEELGVCEVAWFGFNRTQIRQAKALLEQLVAKHKPKTAIPFKFDELDEKYDYKGNTVGFRFTESDAKQTGWLTTPVCRRGVAMFFPPMFARDGTDVEVYAKILAEWTELIQK